MTPRSRALVGLGTVAAATAAVVLLLPGSAPPAAAAGLSPYGSCDDLLRHYRAQLRDAATAWGFGHGGMGFGAMEDGAALATGSAPQAARAGADTAAGVSAGVGPGGTGTNLQEQGVDEPDSAKLADGLLVTVAGARLRVLRAGSEPELLSTTTLVEDAHRHHAGEVLLAGTRALALLNGWRAESGTSGQGADRSSMPGWGGGRPLTTLVLLDLTDPAEPEVLERLELEGQYLSARLSDGRVRLVTRSHPDVRTTYPEGDGRPAKQRAALAANRAAAGAVDLDDVLPSAVRTDARGDVLASGRAVGCDDVSRADDAQGTGTLLVTTLDPAKGLAAVGATGVTTDGDLVYASADRLYVATSRWGTVAPAGGDPAASRSAADGDQATTEIHAFDATTDATRYLGTGSVPGYVLGRWALSEHEGRLRVAVTSAPPWTPEGQATVSSLHVLEESDGELATVGRVGGMGKGERIQAVRYFGDLATVVTFRQTDPLYVLDLSRPEAPRVVGELKVPGFSAYLHPLGGDLLLGVGMDADEKTGQVTGVQLSTFDLSDRTRPRQVDRLSLGQGHSIALQESRAFGYDPQRRQALLPFAQHAPQYSESALAVRVGTDGTLTDAGRLRLAQGFQAERVLHDDRSVYVVNAGGIATAAADGLARTGSLSWS